LARVEAAVATVRWRNGRVARGITRGGGGGGGVGGGGVEDVWGIVVDSSSILTTCRREEEREEKKTKEGTGAKHEDSRGLNTGFSTVHRGMTMWRVHERTP